MISIETPEDRLNDALIKGVLEDILRADKAYLLAKSIGEYSVAINASEHKAVLGLWQLMCSNEQTLATAKMFDKPDKRFPTRSIHVVLEILEKHAEESPIVQPNVLFQLLGVMPGVLDAPNLTRAVVQYFRDGAPTDALTRLKESRDKVIAHNEAIDAASRRLPTWGDANTAVAYAKSFVVAIGEAYLNFSGLSRSVNGARGCEIPMQKLLDALGLPKS